MKHCVHFFVGEELDTMLSAVGERLITQQDDVLKYNHLFSVVAKKDGLSFREVVAQNNEGSNGDAITWAEAEHVASDNLLSYWSDSIFDRFLNITITGQTELNVFIHLPLYISSSINAAEMLCRIIKQSKRPTQVDFVCFCEDMAQFVNPKRSSQRDTSPAKALSMIKELYANLDYAGSRNRLVVIQNRTKNGVAVLSEREGSSALYQMIATMIYLLSSQYDRIFKTASINNGHNNVVGIGISSLYFDKYLFTDYLLNKIITEVIDRQNVNNNDVDVNDVYESANTLLSDKVAVLSNFFKKYGDNIVHIKSDDYKKLEEEITEIVTRVEESFSKEQFSGMPTKAALLASLLAKIECELFSSSLCYSNNISFDDLYSEAIDYYINEDRASFYKIHEEAPENPIPALREVNRRLLQAEERRRTLETQIVSLDEQMGRNERAKERFIEDGYFSFGDQKYKYLTTVDEVPLEETYTSKDVFVESVDLRKSFSRVKNQGQQGSCLAFALTSIFEYLMNVGYPQQEGYDLSEAFLYYNARHLDENGSVNEDGGSKFIPSLEALRKFGLAQEKVCQYKESDYDKKPSDEAYKDAATRKLVKAMNVERNSKAIKSAIYDGYPVACSFTLTESFNDSSDGYIPMPSEEEIAAVTGNSGTGKGLHTYHAMVIVGFSDTLKRFVVRNSWGETWGDNGYCYIPYSYIDDERLLNFACIINEVATLGNTSSIVKYRPALEINNSDTKIKYYTVEAALRTTKDEIKYDKKRREALLLEFETQKQLFSNANLRDEFVNVNKSYLQEQNDALMKDLEGKESRKKHILEEFKLQRKRLIISACIDVALILLFSILANVLPASVGLLGVTILVVLIIAAVLAGGVLIKAFVKFIIYYNAWREERDELRCDIKQIKQQIEANSKSIKEFTNRAYAAWLTIRSIYDIEQSFARKYSNRINLINNLRVWYSETENHYIEDGQFEGRYPNISVISKESLNAFFEQQIINSDICEVDLDGNIDLYDNTPEFFSAYKQEKIALLTKRLFEILEALDFNVTAHMANDKFDGLVERIDDNVLSEWERQSSILLQVNSNERPIIETDKIIFASNLNENQSGLLKKLSNITREFKEMNDKYRVTLIQVVSCSYDECVLFLKNK